MGCRRRRGYLAMMVTDFLLLERVRCYDYKVWNLEIVEKQEEGFCDIG